MLSNKRVVLPAFTLLECLVSLLVIAGSIQLYVGLTKVVASHNEYLSQSQEDDWLLFCQQMQGELRGAQFNRLNHHKLYVTKGQKSLAFGKSATGDFRKTNASGRGYQPMLFNVREVQMSKEDNVVQIEFIFEGGMERTLIYAFSEKG